MSQPHTDNPESVETANPPSEASSRSSSYRSWPYVDRRHTSDRREQRTSVWQTLFRRGNRASGRRLGEDRNIYVDVYGRREVVIVLVILILNVLDAYFTLDYLEKGGAEANPVARGLLDLGNDYFVYAKSVLVGLCLVFLLVHKKFSYVNVAFGFLTTFYTLLLAYHLVLQLRYYLAA